MTARVLVTDGDQRAALAVTRSLGRAGYQVVVAGPGARSLAGVSRHCAVSLAAPSAALDPAGFLAAIDRMARERAIEVLLPITDASLLALLPARARLAPARLPFPDADIFARASDKGGVLATAARLGIAVPESVRVAALASVDERILAGLRFPLVIKPERSVREGTGGFVKLGVSHAANRAELEQILAALPREAFPLQLQQRVVGPGVGLFFLLWDGRVVARFAHRRLREKPPAGGVSVYAESIAIDEPLATAALGLLHELNWAGVAMVEFKREAATGTPYLMEINGRFWGSLQLAVDAGVDFPRLLVEHALGKPAGPPPSYRAGVRTRWWWGDVDQLVTRLKRSRAELHLPPGTAGLAKTALEVLVPGLSRGRNEVLRLDDLRPGLHEAREWFRSLR